MAYMSSVEPRSLKAPEKARQPKRKLVGREDRKLILELPAPGLKHWGARNKAAVLLAVRNGVITLDEARQRYTLSTAEFLSWEAAFDALGLEGLALSGRQMRRRNMTYSEK